MRCSICKVDAAVSYVIRDWRVPYKDGKNTFFCLKCAPQEVLNACPSEILKTAKAINGLVKWNVRLSQALVDLSWDEATRQMADNTVNDREENWELLNSQKDLIAQLADARGAEHAFAVALNMESEITSCIGNFDGADVGDIYQVKQASCLNAHLRIPYKKRLTQNNLCFILVIGELPNYKVKGWIHAQEGMKEKYLRQFDPKNKCWWVPQFVLHPMDTLPLPPDYTSPDLPEGLVFLPVKNRQQTTAKEINESSSYIDR